MTRRRQFLTRALSMLSINIDFNPQLSMARRFLFFSTCRSSSESSDLARGASAYSFAHVPSVRQTICEDDPRPMEPANFSQDLSSLLHQVFGFSGFRANQEAVCRAATDGRDVLL